MQTVLDILEWPQILEHLESCCQTGYGRLRIRTEALLIDDLEGIRLEMARVDEAKRLIQRYGDITLQDVPDILPTLRRVEKQGEINSPAELADLLLALRGLRQLARFFAQNRSRELTPLLMSELEDLKIPNPVIEALENLVNDSGELHDSASPDYGRLRGRVREIQAGIRQTLQGMIARPNIAKYLQETIVTQREGRSVLAVKSEHKVDVPGIVHGASATGSTLYIEPKAIVDQNNRLNTLTSELNAEIRRILRAFSARLAPEAAELRQFLEQMGKLDVLMAKARQSLALKANPVEPESEPGRIYLRQARHPLLFLQTPHVVPNDIMLNPPHRTILITGPNTGGKTVLLKLVGLCAMMMRCGLHLPVAEESRMSFFAPVLADIGDAQSITQNLSTFSGHITRLNAFLQEPNLSQALILVDEICAGTDPQEGSALAQALLDAFYKRGATTIVTTHIGELKVAAHQSEGYLNASVEFDAESLSPTYRLILGIPGTSNALNIASRLGVDDEIIAYARERMSRPVSDSATLIESLETKNRQLTFELEEARRLREEIQYEEEQMRSQLNRIEGEKKRTLQLFREGLKDKLRGLEREVDELKKAVRKTEQQPNQKDLQRITGKFRKVDAKTSEIFVRESGRLYPKPGIDWNTLKVGDTVESRSLNLTGTIVEKNDHKKELTIQSGILKTTVPLTDIILRIENKQNAQHNRNQPKKKKRPEDHRPTGNGGGSSHHQVVPESWSIDCDVRGLTAEDAIGFIDKFLDDAMMSNVNTVNVIHGLGTGVLKKAIRTHLKGLPYVKNFYPAPAIEGGDGKTIVQL